MDTGFRVRVRTMHLQAEGILALTLERADGQPLPPAPPGSHVDLQLAPQLSRSYSVVVDAHAAGRYEVAVARDAASRGGSRQVHEKLRVGDVLTMGAPRNLFPLDERAGASLLIAGGIGITPIWAMVCRLEALGRRWTLCYAARSRRHAAYLPEIEALAAASAVGTLHTRFDEEHGGAPADLAPWIAAAPAGAHLYCCGPQPMLAAYERLTEGRDPGTVHLERFAAAPAAEGDGDGEFQVHLARSGLTLTVPAGQTVLDVLLEHGVNAQYGCMQGACGACEVGVLEGVPEHRDTLMPAELRDSQRTMLVCCSRARSVSLTLDL